MNQLKQFALTAYYYTTLLQRNRQALLRARTGQAPVSVLFYHRVADSHPNAWTIGRQAFAAQMRWLSRHYDLISLSEAQARIASGCSARPAACITFDDGYAENCDFALPLLVELGIPTTYFVATDFMLTGRPFPHDAAAGAPLPPNTAAQIIEWSRRGIEIGAHTRSHANLGSSTEPEFLADEIVGSKRDLEELLGREVNYFACPYGLHQNMTPAAFAACYTAGFAGVCSAYGGYNFPGNDPFHLQRIHADPEMIRLKNWLTVDPLKLKHHIPFDPGDYGQITTTSLAATR